MRTCTMTFIFMFMLSAIALGDQSGLFTAHPPIEVILDFKNHLALVPEGTDLTVIPPVSASFRISQFPAVRKLGTKREWQRAFAGFDRDGGSRFGFGNEAPTQHLIPFVFAYAPDEAFAKYRQNTRLATESHRVRAEDYYYQFIYYADTPYGCPSCYLTLYVDYNVAPYPADDFTTSFTATSVSSADYYRDISIYSSDGYFSCSNWEEYSSADLSCYASDTRHRDANGVTVSISTFAEYWDHTNFYDLDTCVGCNGGYGYGIEHSVHREP